MKKILMVSFAVLLLVVSSASASLAYFTDKQSAGSTFTVGSVGITLEQYIGDSTTPQKGNVTIDKIVPGKSYTVKPVITVDQDAVDCYLFVKVENNLADIETSVSTDTIEAQMKVFGWEVLDEANNIYYYKEPAKAGYEITVFDHFTVAGASVDSAKLEDSNDKTISITAYAIQAAGFDSAAAAWTAAVDAGNIIL